MNRCPSALPQMKAKSNLVILGRLRLGRLSGNFLVGLRVGPCPADPELKSCPSTDLLIVAEGQIR